MKYAGILGALVFGPFILMHFFPWVGHAIIGVCVVWGLCVIARVLWEIVLALLQSISSCSIQDPRQ